MARKPTTHFKILVSLLYNRYRWVTRHPAGSQTLPTAPWARALRMQPATLKRGLDRLNDAGLLDLYQWHRTYTVVRPKLPCDMAWVLEGSPLKVCKADGEAESGAGYVLDLDMETDNDQDKGAQSSDDG